MQYDKKRLFSTVLLGLFLLSCIIVAASFAPLTLESLKSEEGGAGEAIGAAFGGMMMIIVVFMAYGAVVIASAICLPFAISNRRSTLKAVRIISYAYDGLFAVLILFSIVKVLIFVFAK